MKGSGSPRSASTTAAEVELEPSGLVCVRVREGAELGVEEMREIRAAHESLTSVPGPVLIDLRLVRSMSREAQSYAARPDLAPRIERGAILLGNPVSVLLGNFFLFISRPAVPTRLFRSEDVARAWLLDAQRNIA